MGLGKCISFQTWRHILGVYVYVRFQGVTSNQLQDHDSLPYMNSNIKSSKKYLKHLYHLESRWLATPISIHLSWPRSLVATFLGVASHLLSLRVMLCKYSLKDHALLQSAQAPKPHQTQGAFTEEENLQRLHWPAGCENLETTFHEKYENVRKPWWWSISHLLHGTGIFTYIWHQFMVN